MLNLFLITTFQRPSFGNQRIFFLNEVIVLRERDIKLSSRSLESIHLYRCEVYMK